MNIPWILAAMMDIKISKQHCVAICDLILADGDVESQPGPRKRRSKLSTTGDAKRNKLRRTAALQLHLNDISEENMLDPVVTPGSPNKKNQSSLQTFEQDNDTVEAIEISHFNRSTQTQGAFAGQGSSNSVRGKKIAHSIVTNEIQGHSNDSSSQTTKDQNTATVGGFENINYNESNEQPGPSNQDTNTLTEDNNPDDLTDRYSTSSEMRDDSPINITGIRVIRAKQKQKSGQRLKQTFRTKRPRNNQPSLYKAARSYNPEKCPENNLGTFNTECGKCGALHFSSDMTGLREGTMPKSFPDCCCHGTVEIDPLKPPTGILKDLYLRTHSKSAHFLETIRQYNSSLAFASMIAKTNMFSSQGPYSYSIHGQVYHNIGSLKRYSDKEPCYAQLYIMDSDLATEIRYANNNNSLDKLLLRSLESELCSCNPFAKSLKMMKNVIDNNYNNSDENGRELMMIFDINKNLDQRRYNIATENEIAAVFASEDGSYRLAERPFSVQKATN